MTKKCIHETKRIVKCEINQKVYWQCKHCKKLLNNAKVEEYEQQKLKDLFHTPEIHNRLKELGLR